MVFRNSALLCKPILWSAALLTALATNSLGQTSGSLSSGLAAYWPFDEHGGGTALDASGKGNVATLENGAMRVSGKVGSGALQLDGQNDRVTISTASFDGSGHLTVAVWVKKVSDARNNWITDMQTGNNHISFGLDQRNGMTRVCFVNGPNGALCTGSDTSYLGQWTHLAVSRPRGGSGTVIYVNGAPIASGNVGADLTGATWWAIGGASDHTTARAFNGQIDDLRIYNRVLTASEINQLMSSSETTAPVVNEAPVRSSGSPSGTLAAGTASTSLSLTTNETSTCKYATTPGISYASMTTGFSTSNGTVHSRSLPGLSNGSSYSFYVRCQSSSGNANTDDYPIAFSVASASSVDTTPPSVSLTSPASGSSVAGTVNVAAAASDNTGVAKVEFYIDGSLRHTSSSTPYSYAWNASQYASGEHTLAARAYDAAGNARTSAGISVTIASTASGGNYYVSQAGNDSNPGTLQQPWRTILKAVNTMKAGETTLVRGGSYDKFIPIGWNAGAGYDGTSAKSGAAGAPITLKAYPGETVTLTSDSSWAPSSRNRYNMIEIRQRSYWIIEGFRFSHTQNSEPSASWWTYGIHLQGPMNHIVIRNNIFNGNQLVRVGGTVIDLRPEVNDSLIENNSFIDWPCHADLIGVMLEAFDFRAGAAAAKPNRNNVIRGNRFSGLGGDGIQIGPWGGYNTLIENNTFTRKYNGGAYSYEENGVDVKKSWFTTIRKNTLSGYRPKTTGGGAAILVHGTADDVLIDSNTIYDSDIGIRAAIGSPIGASWYTGETIPERYTIMRNIIIASSRQGTPNVQGRGLGMMIDGIKQLRILHNVIAFSEGDGIALAYNDGEFRNNIIYQSGGIDLNHGNSPLSTSYGKFVLGANILYNTAGEKIVYRTASNSVVKVSLSGFQSATGQAAGSSAVNPHFVSPSTSLSSANYELLHYSPAIDGGNKLSGINDGFAGNGPDLGAREYGAQP